MNNTEINQAVAKAIDTNIYEAQAAVAEAQRQLHIAQAHAERQTAQYDGWSRFFLVRNNNGHIHSSMGCSTCHPTTQYAWITQLSGKTEADAVAELGEILCSVCFPSAPVEWTNGTSNEAKAAKVAADEAKAARAIADEAKAERKLAAAAKAANAEADRQVALDNGTVKLNPTVAKLVAAHGQVTVSPIKASIYDKTTVVLDVLFDGKCVGTVSQTVDGKARGCSRMFQWPEGGGFADRGTMTDLKTWVAEQVEDREDKNTLRG